MTLVTVWRRRFDVVEELLAASDSRLKGGYAWDACPKLFALPRGDAVIGFAGDTHYAYPPVLHMLSYMVNYRPARTRGLDLTDLVHHLTKVIEATYATMKGEVEEPTTSLVIGGYSWIHKKFIVRELQIGASKRVSVHRCERAFSFFGDGADDATRACAKVLRDRGKKADEIDMEPFEVLRDILRANGNDEHALVAGPPQLVKVHQHLNANHVAVWWPSRSTGGLFLGGRPLLEYEKTEASLMDPDSLEVLNPAKVFFGVPDADAARDVDHDDEDEEDS